MEAPGQPHVRIYNGEIYVERVPNAWVYVGTAEDWKLWDEPARKYMTSKALTKGLDSVLPSPKTSGPTELPPIA